MATGDRAGATPVQPEAPTTEAGRRLIKDAEVTGTVDVGWIRSRILAIEAEARAASLLLSQERPRCLRCGATWVHRDDYAGLGTPHKYEEAVASQEQPQPSRPRTWTPEYQEYMSPRPLLMGCLIVFAILGVMFFLGGIVPAVVRWLL